MYDNVCEVMYGVTAVFCVPKSEFHICLAAINENLIEFTERGTKVLLFSCREYFSVSLVRMNRAVQWNIFIFNQLSILDCKVALNPSESFTICRKIN